MRPPSPAHGQPGRLLAFEGVDGAGKTTQLHRLAARLRELGLDVHTTKEPTSGPVGQAIRDAAREGRRLPPEDELQAFLADRRAHVGARIGPALQGGAVVLVDRYYFSSIAYQGARGLDPARVQALNEAIAPQPDRTLLFTLPVAVGLARVRARGAADAFEDPAALELVARGFAALRCPSIARVEAAGPEDAVEADVLDAIAGLQLHPALP
jgi:dTMP kinase